MWDFVMDKSGAGAGFLQELRFTLPIYIPSASPQSSSLSPQAGTIGSANSLTIQNLKKTHSFCLLFLYHSCNTIFIFINLILHKKQKN
jgi:hypothetical protein